jgi:hypothetical protein
MMDANENRSSANLILLCIKHADEVDLPANIDLYPADVLRAWKAAQLASYDRAIGGWHLSDEEAAEVLKASINASVRLQADTIFVGGIGGLAQAASGGGGGAIGVGAIGGPGGHVGRIELDGAPGKLPGSGGGGGGVIASGAIVPDPDAGLSGTEGRGFSSGTDGQDGGESSVSGDDFVLRTPGAKGGLAGTGVRIKDHRLSVSALMLVNYAECRGLASIVGGGWQSYSVLNVPVRAVFPLYILFEAGGIEIGEYTVGVEARGPDGMRRARVNFPLTVEAAGDVVRIPRCCSLATEIDAWGLWKFAVVTPDRDLAQVDLLIKHVGEE